MRFSLPALLLASVAISPLAAAPVPVQPVPLAEIARQVRLPFEQFTLPNGLRVVVSTDRKAPVVAVSVWYHTGSKDEPAGKTGFAHLFEHLMFYGSENVPGGVFKPLEAVGATEMNGSTHFDRTVHHRAQCALVATGAQRHRVRRRRPYALGSSSGK